ncbi:hypothetical protein [Flavobacterium capsici]|uniref:Seryl-tRNA synthetase n=1 Tax=Flavobacterium capsici TaxID=3075618 RepID=A0AA96ETB0_9FLAO|nr:MULTISPECIES: hypothetical protein [unclassified Flavobacterium]WNM18048.1 hypothetical protein RN608_08490 [Flavobacterium sp. PMR2A8]WNM22100.1 hypothetical protein RN605_01790 [Flavobacterium sp. PMTSA4]
MILLFSLSTFTTVNATGNERAKATTEKTTEIPAEVQIKLDRLEEIKEMDKSEMTRAEKKELRKEVRAIKAELRSTGNGLYISAGAIIIILLLIILL